HLKLRNKSVIAQAICYIKDCNETDLESKIELLQIVVEALEQRAAESAELIRISDRLTNGLNTFVGAVNMTLGFVRITQVLTILHTDEFFHHLASHHPLKRKKLSYAKNLASHAFNEPSWASKPAFEIWKLLGLPSNRQVVQSSSSFLFHFLSYCLSFPYQFHYRHLPPPRSLALFLFLPVPPHSFTLFQFPMIPMPM
ncbi:hypothetical protein FRC02_004076, partial [Tulasnella sp. 418]